MRFTATTFKGLEQMLSEELKELGFENINIGNRAVDFDAEMEDIYKANLKLGLAIRVLLNIGSYDINSTDDIYHGALKIDWQKYFKLTQTFSIQATGKCKFLSDQRMGALKIKDAIADHFRNKYSKRPDVGREDPDVTFYARITDNKVYLSIDTSGRPLFQRNYKQGMHPAAMNEVLARALVKSSGWDGKTPLFDPFCGSGTILTEAAIFALGVAPNFLRRDFAFQNFMGYDPHLFEAEVKSLSFPGEIDKEITLFGMDLKNEFVQSTKRTFSQLGLSRKVKIAQGDFFKKKIRIPEGSTIICNPPYGERLELDDSNEFYRKMGDRLKFDYTNQTAWVFSGNIEAMKFIGMKPSQKFAYHNGPIECSFRKYETY